MIRPRRCSAGRPLGRRGERGASAVEYALVAVLIAVVIIASVTLLGGKTSSLFQRTCDSIPSAGSTC
jgi:Flp pilus assembly pilin Flp